MSKEIEKPFRCSACTLSFTNEDHLQVHKRRHEMSLNLSKASGGGGGGGGTANTDNFVDETPTPTRFIRNCEEVGLFQDLQNVNPFDEQFVKAASATPSAEAGGFDFTFSFRHSNNHGGETGAAGGGECAPTDTLNTPQVFAFQPATPVIIAHKSSTHGHVSQKDSPKGGVEPEQPSQNTSQLDTQGEARQKNVLDLSRTKIEESPSTLSAQRTQKAKRLILATKNKSNLRLKLTSQNLDELSDPNSSGKSSDGPESSKEDNSANATGKTQKRAGLLERNRAAASRSRERRKRYISALEIKCATLQAKLNQSQVDLMTTRAENAQLREELNLHDNCNVTHKRLTDASMISNEHKTTIIVSPPIIYQNPSTLLPQSITTMTSPTPVHDNLTLLSTAATAVKRGRPKRGFEKRVSDLSFLPIPSASSEPVQKIRILPMQTYKQLVNVDTKLVLLKPAP